MSVTYRGHPVASVEHNRCAGTYVLIGMDGCPVAELKQHEFLSFPQLRTLRHGNGGHRKSNTAVYSGPARKSYYIPYPRTYSAATATWLAWDPARPEPTIENAGIRAGEVIAYRGWRVDGDRLRSIFKRRYVWNPGEPMRGDVRHEYGVHAFKSAGLVKEYFRETQFAEWMHVAWLKLAAELFQRPEQAQPRAKPIFALGTVALWGEIVEHERGYRAEFAKVRSIEAIEGADDCDLLDRLRAAYSVSHTSPKIP